MSAHAWTHFGKRVRFPWPYCSRCGLVFLKNDVTRKAAKKACSADKLTAQEKRDSERVEEVHMSEDVEEVAEWRRLAESELQTAFPGCKTLVSVTDAGSWWPEGSLMIRLDVLVEHRSFYHSFYASSIVAPYERKHYTMIIELLVRELWFDMRGGLSDV